jgi:hypothetical protein
MTADTGWTSLEITKLAVGALTPLAVLGVGFVLARLTRRVEAVQWANQAVVTRRLELFTQIAPKLNQLLCFATFVGRWKEIRPEQAVALKRDLDETMYSNRVLFSDELFTAYEAFMLTLFDIYTTTDADAPLRAHIATSLGNRRKRDWWQEPMAGCFSPNPSSIDEVWAAYHTLGEWFRADLYVTHTAEPLLSPRQPPDRPNVPVFNPGPQDPLISPSGSPDRASSHHTPAP